LAVLIFYNIRIKDRYQDHFLGFGALCGISAAAVASFSQSNSKPFRDFVPISITGALVLSLGVHIILSWMVASPKRE
jgi:hypothetical protein